MSKRSRGFIICKHCGNRRYHQARGLCRTCYKIPAVLVLYPRTRNTLPSSEPVLYPKQLPPPTRYRPGSVEKVLEMAKRLEQGMHLYNPKDADRGGEGTDLRGLSREEYLVLMSWTNADGSVSSCIPPSMQRERGGRKRQRKVVTT